MIRKILKSKTLLFSLLLAVMGVVEANTQAFARFIGPDYFGLFVMVVSIITAVLRVLTRVPLKDK